MREREKERGRDREREKDTHRERSLPVTVNDDNTTQHPHTEKKPQCVTVGLPSQSCNVKR